FVGGVVRPDHAETAAALLDLAELHRHRRQGLRPRYRLQLSIHPQQRRLQPIGMVGEIKAIPALHTQERAVDPRAVAIVPADDLIVARAERGLAAISAVRADGADMLHLP